jgi:hypothetical protein
VALVCTTTTWCGWAWPYVQPVRDGVALTDLDSRDQRIGKAIKAIEHELVRHQAVKMRIPLMSRAPLFGGAIPTAGEWLGLFVGHDPNRYRAVLDERG